jgi:Tfp pilus assembly protein PilF
MSLLLQALQKASKNRSEGEEPGPDPLDSDELTLEPLGRPDPTLQRESDAPVPAVASTPAQAAAIMQARRAPAFDPMDYVRDHYMIVFLGCAVLVAAAYGGYVYVQVSNPSWLRPKPSASARPLPPLSDATPATGQPSDLPQSESASAKLSGIPAATPATAAPDTAPTAPTASVDSPAPGPTSAPNSAQAVAVASTNTTPVTTARSVPRTAAASRLKFERAVEPAGQQVIDDGGIETVVLRQTSRAATAGESVSRSVPETAPAAASNINRAYEALQAGDGQAKTLYAEILRDDPKNIDALLGSAAIAWKDGRADEAAHFYQRILELEPRNAYAQAGLISMVGGADPAASESRLRQLIAREPSAFLYFTLGNLYADQGQWPAAQQAYFQAYQSQPDNPDYAFNLAVGLEHLGQTGQALDFYRKALDLSFRKGRANFDQSLVIQRVGQLSSRVEQ